MTRSTLLVSLAAAFAVAVAACAAAPKTEAPPRMIEPPLSGRPPGDLRDQIRRLDEQIQRELAAANIEPPDAAAGESMAATPMADVRTTCEHIPSQRCDDVCKLSDSICANATSICDLAAQLPGDTWAAERCGAAKASCQRASERCCTECAPSP